MTPVFGGEWRVSVPLDELNALLNFKQDVERIHDENAQLRRELDGLRNMFNELSVQFGEVKREVKGR